MSLQERLTEIQRSATQWYQSLTASEQMVVNKAIDFADKADAIRAAIDYHPKGENNV